MKPTALWKAALVTALFATTATPAYAIYAPDQAPNKTKTNTVQAANLLRDNSPSELAYALSVNGKSFASDQTAIYRSQNQIMVPIRTIAEEFGYALTWNSENLSVELAKGNQWFQLQIGADQYNFARMIVKLGTAPELTDSKTYVPLAFITDVLQANVQVGETGTISISEQKPEQSSYTKNGVITSVGESRIHILGSAGELVLNLTEATSIATKTGEKRSPQDLKLGMDVEVETEKWMTLSLPPITNALKITVDSADFKELLGTAGEITDVQELPDGVKQITVKGTKLSEQSQETIVLVVSDKTVITEANDNRSIAVQELKAGQKLHAFYGPAMTRSLPPIGQAVKLVVEN